LYLTGCPSRLRLARIWRGYAPLVRFAVAPRAVVGIRARCFVAVRNSS